MLVEYQGRVLRERCRSRWCARCSASRRWCPAIRRSASCRAATRAWSGSRSARCAIPVDENVARAGALPRAGEAASRTSRSPTSGTTASRPTSSRGKIALIGTSAPGLVDLRATPVGAGVSRGGGARQPDRRHARRQTSSSGRRTCSARRLILLLARRRRCSRSLVPRCRRSRPRCFRSVRWRGYAAFNLASVELCRSRAAAGSGLLMVVACSRSTCPTATSSSRDRSASSPSSSASTCRRNWWTRWRRTRRSTRWTGAARR